MQTICAVIFDVDGLMFDSERVSKLVFEKLNKQFSIPLTETWRQSICGKNEEMIRNELKNMFPELDVDAYRTAFSENVQAIFHKRGAKCKKGLKSLLKFLQKNHIPMAIASGSQLPHIQNLLEKAHIDISIFSAIVCGSDNVLPKPHPDIFLKACEHLHVKPEHTIVLEESPNGIIGAYKAGCMPIMVPDLIKPTPEIQTMCYKILPDLYKVKKEVKNAYK